LSFPSAKAIKTPRGRFAVRQFGQGPDLVMVHGWPQSGYCWRSVAERLADRFRITLPDLRGLGDSERTPGVSAYAKDQLALDLWSVLDTLEIEPSRLTGHDWGGAVSQEMVLARPGAIEQLALINICLITNHRGNSEAQQALNARGNRPNWYQHFMQVADLPEALIPGNEEAWVRCFLPGVPEQAIEEYVRCYRIPGTAGSAAGLYRSFPEDIKRWTGTRHEPLPVDGLYIHGRKDRVVIPEFLNHAESCFRSLRIESIDAGHFVPEEKPVEVARWLSEFFGAQTTTV
jgi:pimeloyl-ACP methyl ester carboxylesterase